MVLPWRALLAGDAAAAEGLLRAVRQACCGLRLKVILETGELRDDTSILRAARLALDCGADFLKTSTGKTAVSATPQAARLLLQAIDDDPPARQRVGMKVSGGIRRVADAMPYIAMCGTALGADALRPPRFRIGASSLLNDIEALLGVASGCRGGGPVLNMLPQEIIRIKRDGGVLDARTSTPSSPAWSMARGAKARPPRWPWRCSSSGLSSAETIALTQAMTHSGDVLTGPGSRRPGARQTFHRRCRRQGQPDARADRGRLRRGGADDLGPRPGPHRRHARQARQHSRLPDRARTSLRCARRCAGRLRHHRPDGRAGTGRPAAVCDPRRHRDGGIDPADHRQHPVEEAGRRAARPGDGREVRQRRLRRHTRDGAGAGALDRRRCQRCRPADARAGHRHEPGARPRLRQRAGGAARPSSSCGANTVRRGCCW